MGNYASSNANEWLIVIENGELKRAGIGLKTFYSPLTQTLAKFPSSVQKVTFSAEQVSKEMQGVAITSVMMWTVNRLDDGPYRFFKYAGGQSIETANDTLRLVAESILRNVVANHTISEIMSQRDIIRTTLKKGIMDAVQGWGVWVETVELTEVKILSGSLFNDLQAVFRQETNLTARRITLETQQKIAEEEALAKLRMAEKRADNEAQQRNYESAAKLQCEEQEATLFEKQSEIAARKLEQKKVQRIKEIEQREELRLMESMAAVETDNKQALFAAQAKVQKEEEEAKLLEKSLEIATQKLEQQKKLSNLEAMAKEESIERSKAFDIKMKALVAEADNKIVENRNVVENKMTENNMKKYSMDITKEIYQKLPLHSVNMNNYVTDGKGGAGIGVEQLLPALTSFTEANHARTK
jgi:uncharacterized membrane protein YqiK